MKAVFDAGNLLTPVLPFLDSVDATVVFCPQITSFRVKSTHADSFVAKTLVTAVITLQIVIFALQLILGPSNPVLLVFIGYCMSLISLANMTIDFST